MYSRYIYIYTNILKFLAQSTVPHLNGCHVFNGFSTWETPLNLQKTRLRNGGQVGIKNVRNTAPPSVASMHPPEMGGNWKKNESDDHIFGSLVSFSSFQSVGWDDE